MKSSMKRFSGAALILMICLNSCTMLKPGLIGQDSFQGNADELNVTGRFGWNFNKSITFGPFRTSKFNSGLTKINNDEPGGWHFDLFQSEYSSAKQRFSFKQFDSAGNSIEVLCLAKRSAKTTRFSKSLSGEEVLNETYEILMYQNNSNYSLLYSADRASTSLVSFEKDTFMILNDYKYDTRSKKIFSGIIIKEHSETVAAADLTNQGTVWIRKDLDNIRKLRLAAISTAILLRPNLQNAQ